MPEIWRILIPLLIAHLLVDFFLQTRKMVHAKTGENASKWLALSGHSLLAGLLAYGFTTIWTAHEIFWITAVSHFLTDAWKSSRENPQAPSIFWIDQALHLAIIIALTLWLTGIESWLALGQDLFVREALIGVLGFLFVLNPCSIIIQKTMARWEPDIHPQLPDAGHYIGLMERILILMFILLQQYAAIGLLIAAKSILRFGNKRTDEARKESEYILTGTLLSFTLAVVTGVFLSLII
jgi:hypothetical protein